jgi:putative hemolysin
MDDLLFWTLSTLFWTAVMSFYSMQEMACISCNRLRVDFLVAQNVPWAKRLHHLQDHPSILFSTTLIGVNIALMISSECSRRLFAAANLDSNFAPLFEIPFILIFGELVPMFAARMYPEHVCRLGISFLYTSSKLLFPLIRVFGYVFTLLGSWFGGKGHADHRPFLSRDELQKLIEEHHLGGPHEEAEVPVDLIIRNIFSIRHKRASQFMQPLEKTLLISSQQTIQSLKSTVKDLDEQECFFVYTATKQRIIGIVYLSDLLAASDTKKVREFAKSPSFVNEDASALDLLFQLQSEEVQDAVVLSSKGNALGVIFFSDLVDELLGTEKKNTLATSVYYLEKTISADTTIKDFSEAYGIALDPQGCTTFSELIEKQLERHPNVGDSISLASSFGAFELIVQETSLFKVKRCLIRTKKV